MNETRDILTLAVEIGDAMLQNGGEIYRVEDTVMKIMAAYQLEDYDVYVLSNGIFASANEGKEDACSMIRHVPLGSVNLLKISKLNQLARDICDKKCTISEAWVHMDAIIHHKKDPLWIRVLCTGIGSGGFAILFGANFLDGSIAFGIGLLLQLLMLWFEKHHVGRFANLLICSMFVTALSLLPMCMGLPVSQDKIVIGCIMPLVPGIAFTTSIRDFYNSDYLSGVIHLLDALLTALFISVGVGLTIYIFQSLGGVMS